MQSSSESQTAGEGDSPSLSDAVLRPSVLVRGHHAFESCVGRLATAIRLGLYPEGSTLPPERELAEKLDVSRPTVREAITALRTAGFVHTTRGRGGGTVINHHLVQHGQGVLQDLADHPDDLFESLDFRRVVEPGACHHAASRELTDVQVKLLRESLAAVTDAPDSTTYRKADSRLHLAIASVTDSRRMIDAVTQVQADLHDMLTAIPVLNTNIEHSDHQHRAIVEAILAGEAYQARLAMERHCDDTAALLRGLLS